MSASSASTVWPCAARCAAFLTAVLTALAPGGSAEAAEAGDADLRLGLSASLGSAYAGEPFGFSYTVSTRGLRTRPARSSPWCSRRARSGERHHVVHPGPGRAGLLVRLRIDPGRPRRGRLDMPGRLCAGRLHDHRLGHRGPARPGTRQRHRGCRGHRRARRRSDGRHRRVRRSGRRLDPRSGRQGRRDREGFSHVVALAMAGVAIIGRVRRVGPTVVLGVAYVLTECAKSARAPRRRWSSALAAESSPIPASVITIRSAERPMTRIPRSVESLTGDPTEGKSRATDSVSDKSLAPVASSARH